MRVESGLCHEMGTESGSAVLLRHHLRRLLRSDIHYAEESGMNGETRPEEW